MENTQHWKKKKKYSVADLYICQKTESQASKYTILSIINATILLTNLLVKKPFLWLLKNRKTPLFTISGGFICYCHTPGATETEAGLFGGKHQMPGHLGPWRTTSSLVSHDVRGKVFSCKGEVLESFTLQPPQPALNHSGNQLSPLTTMEHY